MEIEKLETIGKLFDLARQAQVSFDTPIELHFTPDAETGEIVVWNDKYSPDYNEFQSLGQAKQILLDMFSM